MGNCILMSLRGSEATEAISELIENDGIAALSRQGGITRNDKKGLSHSLRGK